MRRVRALIAEIEQKTLLRAEYEADEYIGLKIVLFAPVDGSGRMTTSKEEASDWYPGKTTTWKQVGYFRVSEVTDVEADAPDRCKREWRKLGKPSLWVVRGAEWFEPSLRRRGFAKVVYRALFEYVKARGGVIGPDSCAGGSTSEDAERVWRSLRAQYGATGELIVPNPSNPRRGPINLDLATLQPSDSVLVYHGTGIEHIFDLINGFDATQDRYRYYGGPRHSGLFVTPTFETAQRFASYGELVLELEVRAKNLHGTDFSGRIGRVQDMNASTRAWTKEKYPESFRPYLSMTLLQSPEPQALLLGLVSPGQIKRVWYQPYKKEGKWYSRPAFLRLGLEATPGGGYGSKKAVEEVGIDLSSPGYSAPEVIAAVARIVGVSEDRVVGTLETRVEIAAIPGRSDVVAELLEEVGFYPRAAKSHSRKIKQHLAVSNPAYDPAHTVSAVVVVRKGNRILLLERGPTDPWMPGKWCFPGGAIDPGEGPFAGALRELREEAGLHATEADLKPLGAIPIGNTVVYAFETELPGKIRLVDGEHSAFRWLTPTEIQSYPTIPLVKEIARATRTR